MAKKIDPPSHTLYADSGLFAWHYRIRVSETYAHRDRQRDA